GSLDESGLRLQVRMRWEHHGGRQDHQVSFAADLSCRSYQPRQSIGPLVEAAAMPISPLEAINRLNEPVTVEMLVKRAKSCTGSSQFFLDCEENHRDPKNLGVVVTTGGAAKFKEAGIDDPADHFKGKTIRV